MVPWDPMEHPTSPWSGTGLGLGLGLGLVRAGTGTGGTFHEILRYRETMGLDGQERPSILGLVGCPMGFQGTMGQ